MPIIDRGVSLSENKLLALNTNTGLDATNYVMGKTDVATDINAAVPTSHQTALQTNTGLNATNYVMGKIDVATDINTAVPTSKQEALQTNTGLNATNYVMGKTDVATDIAAAVGYVVKPANQSAATFTSTSSAKSKIFLDYFPIVTFEAGACTIDIANIYSKITLQGDTRPLAGHSWRHGIAVRSTKTGAGVGTVTLSTSGNDLTIACATTNPDTTGWTTDDRVLILSASKAVTLHDITNISSNTLTLDPAPPTVKAIPATVTLIPNRTISSAVYLSRGQHIVFQGFFFDSITADDSINAEAKYCEVELENCAIYNTIAGVALHYGSLKTNAETTIIDTDYGIFAHDQSHVELDGTNILKGSLYGIECISNTSLYGDYVVCMACTEGIGFLENSSTRYLQHSQFHAVTSACLFFSHSCAGQAQNNTYTTSGIGVASAQCSNAEIHGQSFSGNHYNIATYETGYIHYT